VGQNKFKIVVGKALQAGAFYCAWQNCKLWVTVLKTSKKLFINAALERIFK
jgi:hypothetical protein